MTDSTDKSLDLRLMHEDLERYKKFYKWDKPIPDDIMVKIYATLIKLGYGCWFGDWLNHTIYSMTIEHLDMCENLADFVYYKDHEDICYDENGEERQY